MADKAEKRADEDAAGRVTDGMNLVAGLGENHQRLDDEIEAAPVASRRPKRSLSLQTGFATDQEIAT